MHSLVFTNYAGSCYCSKLSSPGPLIFKQERVGLHNRTFKMYKFRSMTVQKASEEVSKWTTKNDVRVTPVGRFIRKTSIDELPQLFNVLKGDMSLIGPPSGTTVFCSISLRKRFHVT